MTPAWCKEISIRIENTHFDRYKHVDMWLVDLLQQRKAQGFELYSVMAGYGHRVSMSTGDHGVQKFGGCYLPERRGLRPLDEYEKDDYISKYSPPGISDWVRRCRDELGRTPTRGDVVQAHLSLQVPEHEDYPAIGVYADTDLARLSTEEAAGRYKMIMAVRPPSSVEADFDRPPEPPEVPHIGTNLS